MSANLSVLIVEYHCAEAVANCVASIEENLQGLKWECLVVSNSGYSKAELEEQRGRVPGARLVSTGGNHGYAGAVNAGLRKSDSPYVLILNPDARLIDGGMGTLIQAMESDPDVGIMGPRVLDEEGRIQPSCRRWPRPWTHILVRTPLRTSGWGQREHRRYFMVDFGRDEARDVDWVSGGAMLVRRDAIEAIGGMDTRYFLYMEDVDWCRRFWEAGWRVQYRPEAQVQHAGQHRSIALGWSSVRSVHTRQHLMSVAKYFVKYALRRRPDQGARSAGQRKA